MYMLVKALLMALTAGGGPAGPGLPLLVADCRAELNGLSLRTLVLFQDGRSVEADWRVSHDVVVGQPFRFAMRIVAHEVREVDITTGDQKITAFPEPVSLRFEGDDQRALVGLAADAWCITVMRVRGATNAEAPRSPALLRNERITAVPLATPVG